MNRERFDELREKMEATVEAIEARRTDLQTAILKATTEADAYKVRQDVAISNGKMSDYTDAAGKAAYWRAHKEQAEKELRRTYEGPILPSEDYAELKAFIEAESGEAAEKERLQIKEHLEAIDEITTDATNYYHELAELADQADRLNKSGMLGRITVSHMPTNWTEDLLRIKNTFFR